MFSPRLFFLLLIAVTLQTAVVHAADVRTKYNPGPYVSTSPSGVLNSAQAHAANLEFIHQYGKNPNIRGFSLAYRWSSLEPKKGQYKLDQIAEVLALGKQYNKQIAIAIDVRAFGSGKCRGREHPRWMHEENMLYSSLENSSNKVCFPKWWEARVMDKLIALYREIGLRFDDHPNFEMITEGETTIALAQGVTREMYHIQLLRFIEEAKKALPTTMVLMQINFYHDSEGLLEKMLQVGGMAFGLPDVVPCRIPNERRRKVYTKETCYYTIAGYELMREYAGKLAISPNAETWDLRFDQTDVVYRMAAEYLRANHVFFNDEFCSRKDDQGCIDGYMKKQVLPMLEARGNLLNSRCPVSLGECVATEKDDRGGLFSAIDFARNLWRSRSANEE